MSLSHILIDHMILLNRQNISTKEILCSERIHLHVDIGVLSFEIFVTLFHMDEHWIKCGKCLVSRNNITGGFSAEGTESWSGKGVPVPLSWCASAFVHGGPVSAALARAYLLLIHQTLIILFFGIDCCRDGFD